MTTTTTESKKMVTLRSADGEEFEMEESAAMGCQTIRHMIEDECASDVIPLPIVNGAILSKVIEYCKKHVDPNAAKSEDKVVDDELKAWDADFVKLDTDTLFDLILAANYLDIKSLLDLACQKVADRMKDMSIEEVRETFHITSDYTPEEEAEIRRENQWAFEPN